MNEICKKALLCLLDCAPKSANEIADEIGESLATVAKQLTGLVSGNICEEVSQDEIGQYVIRTDIETFAQLVKVFRSNNEEEYDQEIEQFITSEYYHTRIDDQLVDYVLRRFHLDSVCQTDEEKEGIRRILLASPSALLFALHGGTEKFRESRSSRNQLDSSKATRNWFTDILRSEFETPLLDKLIADMNVPAYGILHATLQIRVAMLRTQVRLATPHGKYVEVVTGGSFSLFQATEDLRAGQLVSYVDPMDFCYDGVTFLNLGEFQIAIENFDKALQVVQDPIQKAIVLNNKGLAFCGLKQYQKAIECFDVGIALDAEGQIYQLRENKQLAEERLALATEQENLTEPTRNRFVLDHPVPFEETRLCEFKEIKGSNPARSITNDSDEYAVAFLNREGGRIFWGVRDSDRITVGVTLNERQRDKIRVNVSNKMGAILPPISVENWQLEFHNVYNFQGEIVADLWVVELVVPPPRERDVFYTGGRELFVKTEGGKKKLQGPEITEFIRERLQDETETG